MNKLLFPLGLAALAAPCAAQAAPGIDDEVYGAEVNKGQTEIESIYGRLTGGPDDGEDVLVLEAAHGFTDNLRIGVRGEFEKEPGETREFESFGVEAIYELGKVRGVTLALYTEYEAVFEGADKVETKLLAQRKAGPLDLRFNLIAEKELQSGAPVELEYATSADVKAIGDLRLGVQAFGQLGTTEDFLPRAEHFLGPVAKFEIEGLGPELECEVGYLFAAGKARDDADGQLRIFVEMEF